MGASGLCCRQGLMAAKRQGARNRNYGDDGKEVKRGIFRGVDDDGLLLLEEAGHLTKIYAGDVFYKEEK